MEEEILDDYKKLFYKTVVSPSTYGKEEMWVLHPSIYCVMEDMLGLLKFTSVVGSKFASVICNVHDNHTLNLVNWMTKR